MDKQRKIVDIIKTLKRAPPDDQLQSTTLFNSVDIDDFRLSIQASASHHCKPKIDNLEATEYSEFEVALYFKETPSRFLKLRIYQYFQTWLDYEDDDNKQTMMIFVYMPKDRVNELYDLLSHEKALKLLATPIPITNDTWVVAFGNAFDGIELHGPFDDKEKAQNYAEYVHKKTYADWNIVKLTSEE